MKTRIILVCSILLSAATIFSVAFQEKSSKKKNSENKSRVFSGSYEKEWARVDSLFKKGLNTSALDVVMTIYEKAKKENNAPELVKAVIHRMEFQSYTEEDVMKKIIAELKKECSEASFPARPLLHSMLAETYWKFYQENRYRFLNRTETADFKNDDINTWDLRKILNETINEYKLSLADEDSSKNVQVAVFDAVIEAGKPEESRKFRPSLYDFLAHRALDFFKNDETGLTEPATRFEINSAFYMGNADQFLNFILTFDDSLSLKFNAINLLQDLIAFHQNDAHPGALIDVDLERLKFVYQHLTLPGKDSLYTNALREIETRYKEYPGSTEALYELALQNYTRGSMYDYGKKPEAKQLIKKAKEICDEAISRFPYSQGGLNCKYLNSRIQEKSMVFTVEQVNIPDQPIRARLEYRNLKKIYFRIAKDDRNEILPDENLFGKKLIMHFLSLPVMKQWSIARNDDTDYQLHNVEIKIPELPAGHYLILSASDPEFTVEKNGVAYADCWVSNISYESRRKENGGYEFYLFHRETGAALSEVNASLFVQEYDYKTRNYGFRQLNSYRSNAEGYFSIEPVSEYRNFNIEFTKGDDRLFMNDNFSQYQQSRPDKKIYLQTFFFTDRSIYRPGQTVFFKGIMLETIAEKNSIRINQSTTVTMYDVNGQKVAEQKLTTNEYGTFSGSFTAPVSLLNGVMRISNENGSASFSVEEYKRPKFEVTFEPVSGIYRLNEKITIKGKAVSYAGVDVDRAQVQYRVVRTAMFPYWNYYRREYPSSPQLEISHGTAMTNDKGEFFISFDALPDLNLSKESDPVFNFNIHADVTDLNGETQGESQMVSVSYKTLLLSVDIPETVNRDLAPDFKIGTHNLSGTFVAAKGNISVARLKEPQRLLRKKSWPTPEHYLLTKEEYEKIFPYDTWSDEDNPEKWEVEKMIFLFQFDTGKDTMLHVPGLKEWKQGVYRLEANSKDNDNRDIRFVKYITVFSSKEKQAPVNKVDWFSVLKDNAEPGGTDLFLIGTRDNDVRVLYEIEQKNTIISKQWLTLNNEQKLVAVPIEEKYRGNIAVHFTFVKHNNDYHFNHVLTVPYTNKDLDISFETFRSKLVPGQKEEWHVKIKGKNGERVAAEMLAGMYDASLDAFKPHHWFFNIYNSYYSSLNLESNRSFSIVNSNLFAQDWNVYPEQKFRTYDQLNWFGFTGGGGYYFRNRTISFDMAETAAPKNAMHTQAMSVAGGSTGEKAAATKKSTTRDKDGDQLTSENLNENKGNEEKEIQPLAAIKGRTNFNETAFFFPHLTTNDSGEVRIAFTIPEALTRWKMMGFAHTADLKYSLIEKELITQKELMVIPDPPRFFREGDRISFTSKITNLSDTSLTGTAQLFLYDAITMKPIVPSPLESAGGEAVSFTVSKGQTAKVTWKLSIPEGVGAITYKVVAKAGNFSDGEEQTIPVLSNRMLVTESLPLPVRGNQSKTFEFTKLKNAGASSTLRNHKLTLEFTSNPAWYAVQALPYLMEYPYECSEQIFARYYANAIASHIANSSPKIKAVFDSWKSQSPEALLSNLEKNTELKSLMLEETPWVLDAKDETERKKRIALLFDLNKMSNELNGALIKLQKKQVANGAWSWFEGMPDDRYITQYIVEGFGHLDHLGIKTVRDDAKTWNMVNRAVYYLDARILDDYTRLVESKADRSKNQLSSLQIQYLYTRSYFKDIPVSSDSKKAFDYYLDQSKKFWLSNSEYLQGMIALVLYRYGDSSTPSDIIKSLKENSQHNEELGMYWKNNTGGFYWTQAPVETQALLIEVFDEVANDKVSVDDMKVWLLKQKQTQNWKTTKATAEACYALLLKGTAWLEDQTPVEITVGGIKINPSTMPDLKVEAGTGYFKTSWGGNAIKSEMATVKVENKNNVVAWGALYWQYFEQLDKITTHQTPLNLTKKLFLENPSSTGPVITPVTSETRLKPGDRIKIRIELRVDRDMEYVMMKDLRAAGFEPEQVLSQYKWQDGLGYYETTRDASVNFFFSYLQKGTYVFEYPVRISHEGNFSNGITEIQCMYAPEFSAHSEGIRVEIGK